MNKKKKSHTAITEPLVINDKESVEKLLYALESSGKEIKPNPNPNMKEISAEELWEIIDKVAKEVYDKTRKR